MGTSTTVVLLKFGSYELDLQHQQLRRSGRVLRLEPQPLKVLACLASRAGQLVTREELINALWGDSTFVEYDQGLNYCIRKVRSALGDRPSAPTYIETIPRVGYRFIAPVTECETSPTIEPEASPTSDASDRDADAEPTRRSLIRRRTLLVAAVTLVLAVSAGLSMYFLTARIRERNAQPARRVMLAVLPFENLTGDQQQDYLAAGITEEVTAALGQVSPDRLGVLARSAVAGYSVKTKAADQIGHELNVDYVLTGTVRREGERARITASLVQVSDRSQYWTGSYDEVFSAGGILKVQESVAYQVAQSLSLFLPRRHQRRTESPAALEAYLKGVYYKGQRHPDDLDRAIGLFQSAIEHDPRFAEAYAELSDAYSLMADNGGSKRDPDLAAKSQQAAQKAFELDPESANANNALAQIELYHNYDLRKAEPIFRHVLELDPRNEDARLSYALLLAMRGDFEGASNQIRTGQQINPLSRPFATNVAYFKYLARDYEGANHLYREVLLRNPGYEGAEVKAIFSFQNSEQFNEASDLVQKRYARIGRPELAAKFVTLYKRHGYRKALAETLPIAEPELEPGEVAIEYAFLRDRKSCLRILQESAKEKRPYLLLLAVEPTFDFIRNEPDFKTLLKAINY